MAKLLEIKGVCQKKVESCSGCKVQSFDIFGQPMCAIGGHALENHPDEISDLCPLPDWTEPEAEYCEWKKHGKDVVTSCGLLKSSHNVFECGNCGKKIKVVER